MGDVFNGDIKTNLFQAGFLSIAILLMVSCSSSPQNRVVAPPPPDAIMMAMDGITPSSGKAPSPSLHLAQNETSGKKCSFSSFHRKNTLGYEIDESQHISFRVSPSFDIWNPKDIDAKISFRFTKALGGPANKRPCTYGSGYYGLVPYLTNNDIDFGSFTSVKSIKSMVQERMDERKKEKEEEKGLEF